MNSAVRKPKKPKFSLYVPEPVEQQNDLEFYQNHDNRFIDKDLSWIDFNARVLCQAADVTVPLLERLKFLAISTSNFDEFYMKRVGQLQTRLISAASGPGGDSIGLRQHFLTIRKKVLPLLQQQAIIFKQNIKPELSKEKIDLLKWDELNESEKAYCREYFVEKVFPLLTPLSVDAGHPFPFLSNLSTSIAFALKHPRSEETLFARVKFPEMVPKWICLPNDSENTYRFVGLSDIIIQGSDHLFPGMKTEACMLFRVTRNANLEIDDEDSEDLLELVESHLKERRSGQIIRLEHGSNPDPWILNFLTEELELNPEEIYELEAELDFQDFEPIFDLNIQRLKYPRFLPTTPPSLMEEGSIFHAVRTHDILVHHPYESFSSSVERFVKEASEDPKVLSIKMTVYRVGQVTPLIPYLVNAAEQGKQVVCLVELKARFDEKQNIYWAHTLEKSGVHVVYGIPGLKTHAKALLVIRQDADAIRAYAHCGTGNYHARTANLYTDVGLFTSKSKITNELLSFFNYLTGRSLYDNYKMLFVAPLQMENKFIALIDREIEHVKKGGTGHIMAKMNSLEDKHIIEKLYEASQAGVQIDLIIRGLCCLRPKVPGLSENIRVVSVVGRLLEHSRIFYFKNNSDDSSGSEYYIGSADWMGRNMHRRIEIALPVEEKSHKERLRHIFEIMLSDRRQSWELLNDGTYTRLISEEREPEGPHEKLMRLITEANSAR